MKSFVLVESSQAPPPDPRVVARQQERWCLTLVQLDHILELARTDRTRELAAQLVDHIHRGRDLTDHDLRRVTSLWYDASDEAEGREPRSMLELLASVPGSAPALMLRNSAPIAAGATVMLTTPAASLPIHITELIFTDACADFFVVTSIFCAGREWLVGPVPAIAFAQSAFRPRLELLTIWPGVVVQVTLENIDGAPHSVLAWFDGIASHDHNASVL